MMEASLRAYQMVGHGNGNRNIADYSAGKPYDDSGFEFWKVGVVTDVENSDGGGCTSH